MYVIWYKHKPSRIAINKLASNIKSRDALLSLDPRHRSHSMAPVFGPVSGCHRYLARQTPTTPTPTTPTLNYIGQLVLTIIENVGRLVHIGGRCCRCRRRRRRRIQHWMRTGGCNEWTRCLGGQRGD